MLKSWVGTFGDKAVEKAEVCQYIPRYEVEYRWAGACVLVKAGACLFPGGSMGGEVSGVQVDKIWGSKI